MPVSEYPLEEEQLGEPPTMKEIPTDTNIRNIPVGMGVDPAAANRFNTRKPLQNRRGFESRCFLFAHVNMHMNSKTYGSKA